MKKLFLLNTNSERVLTMNQGVLRLLYTFSYLIFPIPFYYMLYVIKDRYEIASKDELIFFSAITVLVFFASVIICTRIYWSIINLILWIIEGFKESKER